MPASGPWSPRPSRQQRRHDPRQPARLPTGRTQAGRRVRARAAGDRELPRRGRARPHGVGPERRRRGRAVRVVRSHVPARLLHARSCGCLSDRGRGGDLAAGADRGRRLSGRGGLTPRLSAGAALGLQSGVPRLRAPAQRRRPGRSSDAQRRVHSGERRLGRRVGLSAVRSYHGACDDHAAARVPRSSRGVCRPVSGERSSRS